MNKHVLFVQGGGDGGFEEDARLASSLQTELGDTYKVHYPEMPSDDSLPDFGWLQQIGDEITAIKGEVILVGHSLGASMLLKYLSEKDVKKKISGIFLIATPFWSGDENWVQGLKLKEDFQDKMPRNVPVFLYHCRDDQEVPFQHLAIYSRKLPNSVVHEIDSGGHQLDNDLSMVANDIKSL
jgi:uncharacterized protein